MKRLGHRRPMIIASVSVGMLAAAGCGAAGAGAKSSVPAEFRAACGHPGARVHVRKVPVTVQHSACDLTGVLLTYRNYGGAYVSIKAGSIGTGSGLTLTVDAKTQDVTVNATGTPGND
jgi:hypothetical protein